jgi:hypothetical protein
MAKLTRKQRDDLRRAVEQLQRAYRYVHSDRVVVCIRAEAATTTLHLTRGEPEPLVLYPVAKDIGSDLACFGTGLRWLKNFMGEGNGEGG